MWFDQTGLIETGLSASVNGAIFAKDENM